jgi:EmrB/QacA subfamily drug resistance transporter
MSGAPNARANADAEPLPPALLRLLLLASFGPLLLNLGSTSVSVALETLMARFGAPLATMQWVVTGYLLALALVLPTFRFAVERLGSRRLYVGCLLAFTLVSALSACAWSAASLIAFRLIAGAVGGLLAPLAQLLIAQLAGPRRMGRAVSIISIPVLVAPLLGPVIGGLVISQWSWRWLFLINLPIGLIGAWLAARRLPEGNIDRRGPFDIVGLLLLSPGIGLLTYALSSLGRARALSPMLLVWLVLALALVAGFIVHARRAPDRALLDPRIFGRPLVAAALATYLLANFASFGMQLVLPLYFQQVQGAVPLRVGLLMAPQGIGMLLSLPQIGRLADRFDHGKIVIVGVLLTISATLVFTVEPSHLTPAVSSVALVVRGIGLGATSTPALSAAYRALGRDEIATGTAAINIVQRLAAPLGTAMLAITLSRFAERARHVGAPLDVAFHHTFVVAALLGVAALFSGLALVRLARAND